jgi:hypothetical protein
MVNDKLPEACDKGCPVCACPRCDGRGDLCGCTQAEFNAAVASQQARLVAGVPARYEIAHEAWSPAQAGQHK